jgi:hypothetical protein
MVSHFFCDSRKHAFSSQISVAFSNPYSIKLNVIQFIGCEFQIAFLKCQKSQEHFHITMNVKRKYRKITILVTSRQRTGCTLFFIALSLILLQEKTVANSLRNSDTYNLNSEPIGLDGKIWSRKYRSEFMQQEESTSVSQPNIQLHSHMNTNCD